MAEPVRISGHKKGANDNEAIQAQVIKLAGYDALAVSIVDAAGDPIVSFGGGVEYTEGDTDASITGKAILMEGAANTLLPVQGTVADGLLVNLGTNNDVTVTGSVTANAGTNLNTSLLATETTLGTVHGHIDSIDTKLVSGTDIGDVTINNSTGAAAVNIQDGGNTITVDGTVAATQSGAPWTMDLTKVAGASVAISGGTEATSLRVTIASDSTGLLSVDDNGGSITVDQGTATNLKTQAENYQGGTAVGSGNPLQVSLANHAANATAVKVNVASGGIASGGIALGAIASGAIASGAVASGAVASGAFASGSIATGAIVDALQDDTALTVGTSRTFPTSFFADDASPDSVTEGDVGVPRMSLDRIIYCEPPFGAGTTGTTDCTNVSTGYRITSSSTRVHNFRIQAHQANVGTIIWGWSSTYASNYMQLRPGQEEYLSDIDISLLYFGSTFAGDDINYSYTI